MRLAHAASLLLATLLHTGIAGAAVTHPFGGVTMVNHGDSVLVVADL